MPNNGYQTFLIADMRTGKELDREPWLLPPDAWETLRNCHLKRGVLEKRRGYTEFGQIVHTHTTTGADTLKTDPVMGIKSYYNIATETTLAMDYARVNKYDTTTSAFLDVHRKIIHFKHGGVQTWTPSVDSVIHGQTSTATGKVLGIVVDHGAIADGDADGWIIFANDSTLSGTFQDAETLEDNTNKANASYVVGVSDGVATDHEFTLGSTTADQFFWLQNWLNVGYITNNKDQIQRYGDAGIGAGQFLTPYQIDLDVEGGPDNDITACRMVFVYKQRIVLLDTTERGTRYPRRLRWLEVGLPGTAKDDSNVDCDTEDIIITAGFIGEDLIVWFERTTWKIVYTGDVDLPFRWERVSPRYGASATHSLVNFGDRQIAMGATRLLQTDGRDIRPIDNKIIDFTLSFTLDAIGYTFGEIVEAEQQVWLSYTSDAATQPDSALIYNFDDNSFATYELPVHCLGFTTLDADLILDNIDTVLDTIDYSFDDKTLQAGYPILLMGSRDGKVYQLNDGSNDDGSSISFEALGARLNPFHKDGYKAYFSDIEFLVDTDPDVSFTVSFYIDTNSTAHTTKTITCDGDYGKSWKRAYCNAIGEFHRIKLSHDVANQRPRIHAFRIKMKRGGRLI